MMPRYMLYTLLALLVSVIGLTTILSSEHAAAGDTTVSKTGQQTGTELNRVETTPMSEADLANQPQGQSEPGTAESVVGDTGKPPPSPGLSDSPASWAAYVDPTYGFSISYPNGFVVQLQDVSELAQFTPTPVASIFFMNPTMAAGDLAGIEPPDLEVRVYQAEAVDSLKSWLASVGFAAVDNGAVAEPYRSANVSGLKVCQSTLIAPGCSVYVLRNDLVYQLTPSSLEGEAMMETFALLPGL